MKVIELTWQETIPIRHTVLWPTDDPKNCMVDGDDEALHFGILIDAKITCVASIYIGQGSARLRKFATLNEHQGKGLGSFMLNFLLNELKNHKVSYLWLDARESAIDFYKRFDFTVHGERFLKKDIAYFKMHKNL